MDQSKTLATYQELMQLTGAIAAKQGDIAFVQKHGHLPKQKIERPTDEEDLSWAELKLQIRRLDDLIYKTNKKMAPSAKKVSQSKIAEWEEKLSMAIVEREKLKIKITMIEDGSKQA